MDETEELETESVVDTPEDDDDEGFLPQPGDDEPETDEAEDGEEEEEDLEPDDGEEVEVEINGKLYKVPKDAALRQSDYTQKTQDVAEQRKEVAEQRKQYDAAIAQVSQVSEEATKALYNVAQIDVQLAQYAHYTEADWAAWFNQDPISADRAERHIDKLQRAREGATREYTAAKDAAAELAQQETAKRIQEGTEVVRKKIPDWSPEKDAKLTSFALEHGFEPDELRGAIADPRMILILNAAYEHSVSQKKAAAVKKIEKQVEIKPAAKIKGKTGSIKTGLHDGLSTAEWIKRDQARSAQRR